MIGVIVVVDEGGAAGQGDLSNVLSVLSLERERPRGRKKRERDCEYIEGRDGGEGRGR